MKAIRIVIVAGVLLLALAVGTARAQIDAPTSVFKGPVKYAKLYTTAETARGKKNLKEFDNESEEIFFDRSARVKTKKIYFNGELSSVQQYTYDSVAHEVRYTEQRNDGTTVLWTQKFDAAGGLIESRSEPQGNTDQKTEVWHYMRDSAGHAVEEWLTTPEQPRMNQIMRRYGPAIEETYMPGDNDKWEIFQIQRTIRPDSFVVETYAADNGKPFMTVYDAVTITPLGDSTIYTHMIQDNSLSINRWHVRKTDAQGNWTEREYLSKEGGGPWVQNYIENRRIEYYSE